MKKKGKFSEKKEKILFSYLKNRANITRVIIVLLILGFAIISYKIMGFYAESFNIPPSGDFLHDVIPLINLNWLTTYGYYLIVTGFTLIFIFKYPKESPNFVLTMSLFMIIRSILFSVTHLGAPFPRIDDIGLPIGNLSRYYFTQDLFPSGHAGMPFIASLFMKDKLLKTIFLAASFIMGFAVLAMHVHYSIDVLGAYFVAFTCFYIVQKYLAKKFTLK